MFEKIKTKNHNKLFYNSVGNLKEYFAGREGYEWFLTELDKFLKSDDELQNRLSRADSVSLVRLNEISENEKEITVIQALSNYIEDEKDKEKKYVYASEKIIRFILLSDYLLNNGKETVYINSKKWKEYFCENKLGDEVFSNFLEIIKNKNDDQNSWKIEDMKDIFNSFYEKNKNLEWVYSLLDTKKVFEL